MVPKAEVETGTPLRATVFLVHVTSSARDIAILGGGKVDLQFDEDLMYFGCGNRC